MQEKKDIRKEVLEKRMALTKEELVEKSKIICNSFLELPQYKEADLIYIYMDFKNEVMTKQIIEDAWEKKKRVAIPKVVENQIIFYELVKEQEKLKEGYFGIREPKMSQPIMDSEGLMVVPGIAFDKQGYRIGYGKGFYDRYLHANNIKHKISLVFELQMVDKVPNDKYDIPIDMIITEKQMIQCYQERVNN